MSPRDLRIFIGFDPEEMVAWNVAAASMRQHSREYLSIVRVSMDELIATQQYRRRTERRDGQLWDVVSDAPMSTSHAIARFLVPQLCRHEGWALFTDGDVLVRADLDRLVALADPRYAVQVVQHPPLLETGTKKAGQIQTAYARKNWSSVVLWHCAHPAHAALTDAVINTWPGRDLHAFRWLDDALIGSLPATWNWLAGVSAPDPDPALVHFTLGTPDLPGHGSDPFAAEWFDVARSAGYRIQPVEVSA